MGKFKFLFYFVCIFILTLLQTTVFESLTIYSIKPNLLLTFFIIAAMLSANSSEAMLAGFFCGLVQDFVSGKVIGFYALCGLIIGSVVHLLNKRLYGNNLPIIIIFVFTFTIIYENIICLISFINQKSFSFLLVLKRIIILEAMYNSIAAIIIYLLISKIYDGIKSSNDNLGY